MELYKDERVIKSWDYGQIKKGKEITNCNLTVTNRRVIQEQASDINYAYDEIPLKDISGVSCNYQTASKKSAIIKIVLGIIALIIGIAGIAMSGEPFMAIFLLLGIIWLVYGIYQIVKLPLKFNVSVFTTASSCILSVGMASKSRKSKQKAIKIRADRSEAKDMVTTISNAIHEARIVRRPVEPQRQPIAQQRQPVDQQ